MKVVAFVLLTCILGLATDAKSCRTRRAKRTDPSVVRPYNVNRPDVAPKPPAPTRPLPKPGPGPDAALNPAEVAKAVLPSVLLVLCDADLGISQGSGFVAAPGIAVTNYHVVRECGRSVTLRFWDAEDRELSAMGSVTSYDAAADLALIECDALRSVPPLTIRPDSEPPTVGDQIFSVGNPKGLSRTFAAGMVSALDRSDSGSARIQISAPISRGSSGGPVVDARARVVGVAVATIEDGQNLNLAVPATELRRFINTSTR